MAIFDRFRPNIGQLKEQKDIDGLIEVLASRDEAIRREAAVALYGLGAAAVPVLVARLERSGQADRRWISEGLIAAGAPVFPLLLALLIQIPEDAQETMADALAGVGTAALDTFIPALHHTRPAIRQGAAIALSGMGPQGIPSLREALGDSDTRVARAAARSLARLKWKPSEQDDTATYHFLRGDYGELVKLKRGAAPVLIRGLADKDPRVRRDSARALGKLSEAPAIPALVRALDDPDILVRTAVIEALGEIRDPRARPPLLKTLEKDCHQVRMEAAWALDRLGWKPESVLQKVQYLIAKEQWNALVGMGRPAIDPLIHALKEDHSGVRSGATEALKKIGSPALEALARGCRSKDPVLAKAAVRAVAVIRQWNEAEARARPVVERSDRYDRELKEGLGVQKRFEERFGRPTFQTKKSGADRPTSASPEQPSPPDSASPVQPQKPEVSLSQLIEENRRAMQAWTKAKEELREAAVEQAPALSLDHLLPPEFEEEIFDALPDDGDASLVQGDEKEEMLTTFDLPDPVQPPETPEREESEAALTPLERYLRALQDGSEEVRAAAIEALRGMGDAAVDALIGALRDKSYVVRIAAAEALGDMGGTRAVEPLIGVLTDTDQDVRIAGAAALGRLRDRRAVSPLINLCSDPYVGVRHAAADALAAIGDGALEALLAALTDPAAIVRVAAARALGSMKDPRAVPALIERLSDPGPEVRWSAAQALGDIGAPAAAALSLVLRGGLKIERLAAIDALWKIADDRATEALLGALHDDDPDVREKASQALKRRDVLDVWRRALGEQVEAASSEPKKKKKKSISEEDAKAFSEQGQKEIANLIRGLREKTWTSQLGAATRLIMMGRPAAEGLIRALRDEDPEIQTAAAGVLGEMREVAVEPLMNALADDDGRIRIVAARNLGKIGNDRSIETLIAGLHRERDAEVRAVIAEALGYMGKKMAIEPLTLALRDRDEAVQIAAARSLGYIGDRRAIEPLLQALNDVDDRVRHAALEALKDPGGLVQDHLLDALRHGDRELKLGVAEALESLGWTPGNEAEQVYYLIARERWAEVERMGAVAIETLAQELNNLSADVRISAVKTITRIGGTDAVAPLLRALRDDHFAVRRRAERALIEMGETARGRLTESLATAEPELAETIRRILRETEA